MVERTMTNAEWLALTAIVITAVAVGMLIGRHFA
jgi:hypothetical protein